jgi:hypothetical protein
MAQTKIMIIAAVILLFIIVFLFGYCEFFSSPSASCGSFATTSGCEPIEINSSGNSSGDLNSGS